MPITTLAELEAYAVKTFPQDFAKLPPVEVQQTHDLSFGNSNLRFGGVADVVLTYASLYNRRPSVLIDLEPFCWIAPTFDYDINSKTDAILRYYFMRNDCDGYLERFKGDFLEHFQAACADIAIGAKAKEAAVDDPAKWGITEAGQSQIKKLQNRIQQLANTLTQKAATSETRIKQLEQEVSNFKTASDNHSMDWVKQFAASKVEIEELKAKVVKLEKENQGLRRTLEGPVVS